MDLRNQVNAKPGAAHTQFPQHTQVRDAPGAASNDVPGVLTNTPAAAYEQGSTCEELEKPDEGFAIALERAPAPLRDAFANARHALTTAMAAVLDAIPDDGGSNEAVDATLVASGHYDRLTRVLQEIEDAATAIREHSAAGPNSVVVHVGSQPAGSVAWQQRIEHTEAELQRNPPSIMSLYEASLLLRMQGDPATAIKVLQWGCNHHRRVGGVEALRCQLLEAVIHSAMLERSDGADLPRRWARATPNFDDLPSSTGDRPHGMRAFDLIQLHTAPESISADRLVSRIDLGNIDHEESYTLCIACMAMAAQGRDEEAATLLRRVPITDNCIEILVDAYIFVMSPEDALALTERFTVDNLPRVFRATMFDEMRGKPGWDRLAERSGCAPTLRGDRKLAVPQYLLEPYEP
jgi:hypothetical protein